MPLDFFERIVRDEIQDFIMANELADVQKLLLKKNITLGVPTVWVAQQILGRRKAKTKLPHWYNTHRIVYPPSGALIRSWYLTGAAFQKSEHTKT